jgi:hypothetical protein
VVVGDAREFLRARGHRIEELTDYEIEEAFEAAFRNWEHGLVESAFYTGLPWVEKPKEWKRYCDDIHDAIEGRAKRDAAAEELLAGFLGQGVPVAN